MFLIYGKGKVWNWLAKFFETTNQAYKITDDQELNINKEKRILNTKQTNFLKKFDQIIMSPGIPPHHPIYQDFWNKTISELNFLWKWITKNWLHDQLIIVWISGTNGKSTTTHIAYTLLNKIFEEDTNTDVYLSGNFWIPLSETLTEIITQKNKSTRHLIIIECSSFMLYKLQNFSFNYSILTNIETDHLDRHPDKKDYAQTKLNLIKFTTEQAFTTKDVFQKLNTELQNKTIIFNYDYDLTWTQFFWHHNQANIQSVFLLTQKILKDQNINKLPFSMGKPKEELLKNLIKNIKPLAHRMQLYTTINWVDIYDDAICTSAHAQENALKGLDNKVVLICGWYDKWDNFDHLWDLYKKKVAYWVFIGLTAPKFEKIFTKKNIDFTTQKTLHNAITTAFKYAQNKKTNTQKKVSIVFSPACASFDMFKNVYHRIEEFEKEIALLKSLPWQEEN